MARHSKGVEIPENEEARIAAVKSYAVLDTPPEEDFDRITRLAAQITGCPVSYVSIFDETRSWLKSSFGLPPNRPPRPREQSMCAPTICQTEMIVVEDLAAHPRYARLPAVVNPPHARFYCGVPLINADAFALGTLCVWSHERITFGEAERAAMLDLAALTLSMLERRKRHLGAEDSVAQIGDRLARSMDALQRAEESVYRLLPSPLAVRMLSGAELEQRVFPDVSIVSCHFPTLGAEGTARDIAERTAALRGYVSLLEETVRSLGLEPLGMHGNRYLAASGMPREREDHVEHATGACAALEGVCEAESARRQEQGEHALPVSVAVATGPVAQSVVGDERVVFGVWGSPVGGAGA